MSTYEDRNKNPHLYTGRNTNGRSYTDRVNNPNPEETSRYKLDPVQHSELKQDLLDPSYKDSLQGLLPNETTNSYTFNKSKSLGK